MKNKITLRLVFAFFLFAGIGTSQAQLVTTNLDNGSAGSLRNQVASANTGSIIIFAPGITNIVLVSGEITIDKSLVITGNGIINTTVNGNAAGRIFNVTAGNVVLNDITLTNGLAENGGAIAVTNANLAVNNSTISNSVANGASGSGGGILVGTGANLSVLNTFITGNTANRAGGGIESVAGTTTILNNVTLNFNNAGVAPATAAPGNGGGLHITGAGAATINGGFVMMNRAAAEGGGLWNGTGTMTIDGTTITENTASGIAADNGGGGIYNLNGGTLNIDDALIRDNVANGTAGSGGGVLNDAGATLVITNSQITGNTSNRAGGGIENNAGTVTLTDVNLDNNTTFTSPGNGGGLHVTGAGSTSINNGTVNGNNAGAEGGGLWNGTATMTVNGTTISGNTASGAGADQGGGGIYNLNGGTLIVIDAVISNNRANGTAGSGGGILNDVGSQLSVTNSDITGNTAVRAGGGIEDNSGTSTLLLTNVSLNNNSVTGPPGNGGGLHITGGGSITITGGEVNNNTASLEGGGLWNGAGTMTINGTTIDGNVAQGAAADDGGAGIFNNAGTLNITDVLLSDNRATGLSGSGGGLLSLTGTVTINDTTFDSNAANRAGGAIEVVNGTLLITGSAMTNNDVDGGAGTPNPGNGGALHITGVTTTTISNSEVSDNDAKREGGGLWNQTGSTMTVNNTTIDSNTASGPDAVHGGGGIFNNGGSLIVNASTVSNNISDGTLGNGGGIHVKTGTALVTLSTISGNSSANMGGGVYSNAQATVNASTVALNSATNSGGGITNNSATAVTLKNTVVAKNDAGTNFDLSSATAVYVSNGYNLIGQDDSAVFTSVTGDIEGTTALPIDPLLGLLADNGGPTLTHLPLADSRLYNAGDPADLFNDQTGAAVFGGIRDIGAVEAQVALSTNNFVYNNAKKSIVYPNPSINGTIKIDLAQGFGADVKGSLIEIGSGKTVHQFDVNGSGNSVDLNSFSAGVYIVQLTSGTTTEKHKLVIGR